MSKTEYTINDGGLQMEFDIFFNLDEAGVFKELDRVECTGMSICPDACFYRVSIPHVPIAAYGDAGDMVERLYNSNIIEQIEGELVAAKQADGERRRELE